MGKLTVIGSTNLDMIMQLERMPNPGETLLGGHYSTAPGGKGANQAVAAARAGAEVTFISCLGNDAIGDKALEDFAKDGINTTYIKSVDNTSTGVAFIFVDQEGENTIGVASGANSLLIPKQLESAATNISEADIILCQLEIPMETLKHIAIITSDKKALFILDPAPTTELEDIILKNVDILTPNEIEAEQLTRVKVIDEDSARAACKRLHDKEIKTVIITMGDRGAYLSKNNESCLIPSFDADAVDTTGAGDVFNGALAKALSDGQEIKNAIRFANAAAALSVTVLGAQPSAPNEKDILSLLNK
ncbi:MAG: ribokinase [Candidatus Marinimicrobia bacterium]|nr:ribokinase [Candidatus Neomarinimicrobiota bacterium]|tara:strand:- start:17844 stop:18758 length:915 start_codon:yes stop_codon:yes gene_type:complete